MNECVEYSTASFVTANVSYDWSTIGNKFYG
jgi:hypothetical protein